MNIIEYLKTLDEGQMVIIELINKDGGIKIIAWNFAGFIAQSTRPGFQRLEVIEHKISGNAIIIKVKDPKEEEIQ